MKNIGGALRACRHRHVLAVAGALIVIGLVVVSCGRDDAARDEAATVQTSETVDPAVAAGHTVGHMAGMTPGRQDMGPGAVGGEGVEYECACCPDVHSSEPGECPKCHMELTPVGSNLEGTMEGTHMTAPESQASQVWTCSMHPDVRSDQPGQCPDCHMDLVPLSPDPEEGKVSADPETGKADQEEVKEWTCGMHPAIRSEQPGKCPICNMDLIPVATGDPNALRIDGEMLKLVGARRTEAEYLPLVRVVWAVGQVQYDERLVRYVASRVPGRVEKLHADFVGTEVRSGEPLLDIYSPELITALAEYRAAVEVAGDGAGVGELARSAKTRLQLWGLEDKEIDELAGSGGVTSYRIPVRSPISGTVIEKNAFEGKYVKEGENLFTVADLSQVWITADLYEDDMGSVRVGDRVDAVTRSYPGEVFTGQVAFIDPFVNEKTRAAKIRLQLSNPGARLKPGMYVEAKLEVPVSRNDRPFWTCPMHPEVSADGPGECPVCGMFLERVEAGRTLAVAEDAVIYAGETPLAYVETEPGVYEARQLTLDQVATLGGPEGEAYYPVSAGLMPGETVVADAGFLVHSQARLTGRAASAYGGALDVDAGGHHGH
jgi:Cu(I)/Ag(I) efflux system membrane fusion protein